MCTKSPLEFKLLGLAWHWNESGMNPPFLSERYENHYTIVPAPLGIEPNTAYLPPSDTILRRLTINHSQHA